MIKVKICGITNNQDALWAANLGADFIGLNFYPQSPRKVSAKNAKDIVSGVPPFVGVVGIFVDEPLASIAKSVKTIPLKVVQLHGSETPEDCRAVHGISRYASCNQPCTILIPTASPQQLGKSAVSGTQENIDILDVAEPLEAIEGRIDLSCGYGADS